MSKTQDLLAFRAGLLTLAVAMLALLSACGEKDPAPEPYVRVWTGTVVEHAKQRPQKLEPANITLRPDPICPMDTVPSMSTVGTDRTTRHALAERSARGTPARPRSGTAPSL